MSALVIGELVIFALAVLAAGVWALRRASWDWSYQLRLVRHLSVLGATDSPWNPVDSWEAVLVDRDFSTDSRTIAFAPPDRREDVGLLQLDEPLGALADTCTAWCAARTPLLYAGDGYGGAVLHGPNACLVGRVVFSNGMRTAAVPVRRGERRRSAEVVKGSRGPRS